MRRLVGFVLLMLAVGVVRLVGCGDETGTDGGGITYLKASNTDPLDLFGTVSLSADGQTLAVGALGEDSAATGVNGDQDNNSANGAGAVYLFTRNGESWSQQAYLKGGRGSFGIAVSLSADGDTLAVGAFAGTVHVFTRTGSSWSEQARLEVSNADLFGASVSLAADGNTLAVGAMGESSGAGAVYVFTRSGSDWSQQAYVKASNPDQDDGFGGTVSLSADGNILAVGAPGEASAATGVDSDQDDNSAEFAGAVYVFTRSGDSWSQQAYIKASNSDPGDTFAVVSLSADGETLAVGAKFEASAAAGVNGDQDDNSAEFAGAVYVFTRAGSDWSQQAYIKASNTDPGDQFGYAVSLNTEGTVLGVGAVNESSSAVGVNGDQDDNSAEFAGAVYVFTRAGSDWSQQAYVKATNTDEGDGFGGANALGLPTGLSLSGDGRALAVGATGEDSAATGVNGDQSDNSAESSGAAYVYELD